MTPVEFYPQIALAERYPAAVVPLRPMPNLSIWSGADQAKVVSAFLGAKGFFHLGRYALLEALRRAGVGRGHAVLLPSVHCRSMIDPVLHLGAEPLLYRVGEDLIPDMDALNTLSASARVMVLTHYFGFPNALEKVTAFCRRHDIVLIEDCAHAFYGEYAGRPLGTFGSYAAASVHKFLPTGNGALLLDNVGGAPPSLRSPGCIAELRAARDALHWAYRRGRQRRHLPQCDTARCVAQARDMARTATPIRTEDSPTVHAQWLGRAGSWTGKAILASVRHARVVARRRRYYQWWLDALAGNAGAHNLFPSLPEAVVPYAFPVLLKQPEPAFSALRMAGIPMWRWEDMARSDCPVAARYRTTLVQLPVHQELDEYEVQWMIKTAAAILSECTE